MAQQESTQVLVADDDAAQRRLLRHYLRRWGYTVVEASDGNEALQCLRESSVALAVLDWDMPGRSGIDVCRELAGLERFVHAIVLTANSERAGLGEALAAGASDFLLKPPDPIELQARLRVGVRVLTLLEQLAQHRKLESVGSLAAGIAHEINTPAQSVISNLHFMDDAWRELAPLIETCASLGADATPEQVEKLRAQIREADVAFLVEEVPSALKETRTCVENIARIVTAVREYAAASGSSQGALRPENLNAIVEDAVVLTRSAWQQVAVLQTHLAPDLVRVPCVTGALLQALGQMLLNAAEAIARTRGPAPAEKGTIEVHTTHDASHVELRIRDDGPGIPHDIQHRIYDPFFTTKTVGQGMGQGLALVHSVVVGVHRGTVRCESEEGRGATFVVRLPLEVPDSARSA